MQPQQWQHHHKQQVLGQEVGQPQQARLIRVEDLRAEVKEELRGQLEVQKRLADEMLEAQRKQSNERIEHEQAPLSKILSMMRRGARG
jgi:hypothetical protein